MHNDAQLIRSVQNFSSPWHILHPPSTTAPALSSLLLQCPDEMYDDAQLIWCNAKTFNDPEDGIYQMAEELEVGHPGYTGVREEDGVSARPSLDQQNLSSNLSVAHRQAEHQRRCTF